MENLDSAVISTSLPAIAKDLHEDPISLKLALTSYLISLAIFIPASGWAADRFGARTIFRAAILVFILGSILCGISVTLPELVGARAPRADDRAAARRLHHHLFPLALDFLDQRADRRHRHYPCDHLRRGCQGRDGLATRCDGLSPLRSRACLSFVRAWRHWARPHGLASGSESGGLWHPCLGGLWPPCPP